MRIAVLIMVMLCLENDAFSQTFSGGFNFFLPPTDTLSTRFVPTFGRSPLTDQDFVDIDPSGHFSVRGTPIRFFGANLVAGGAFPTPSKAWFIAGRLSKMGFNLVRLHHLDNPWGEASLFEPGWTTRLLNPVTLDRLENLLAALKKNGIYANLNLHVSRTFTTMDILPDTDSLLEYGKGINYFDPDVLFLHKEYARELLTHVNPYTGKSLATDPAMAMVEVTNENSLYRFWRDGKLKHLSQGGILTARHVRMIDSLWLDYLRNRYATTSALAQAWNDGAYPADGLNRVVNGTLESAPPSTGWLMEIHAPAAGSHGRDSVLSYGGKFSARVDVTNADGTDWHAQWKQTGLSVTQDTTYNISFAARSDSTRTISVALMRDISPWNWYGGVTIRLTPDWKTFSLNVRAPESLANAVRLSFTVGGQTGSYWFDDIAMTSVGVKGLLVDESFETRLIRRIDYGECAGFTPARVSDMSSFYIMLEEAYYAAMRSYLKDSLGVRVPIAGTNWNVGPADIAVQSKQDYVDNHAYWDHPSFPGIPWSSTDWVITNTPMVRAQDGGTIAQLFAGSPVAGKPFTVSEYNHPFPNRYQSEAILFLTSYAAFHDADGLMFFDYNSVDDWETDKVANYFSIHRNPAMMALAPSCAAAFREGMISPAVTSLALDYAPADYLTLPRRDTFGWNGGSLIDRTLALSHSVRARSFTSTVPFDSSKFPPVPVNPYITDTREIVWNTQGLLSVSTPRFVGTTGFLNDFSGHQIGPLAVLAANGFGSLTWVSVTPDSLPASRRSLLTLSTMIQNTGMVWDGTTTLHNKWGGPPTQVAPLRVTLQLRMNADSIRVYRLDPSGRDIWGFSSQLPSSANMFTLTIDQITQLSMWFGIEAFGSGMPTDVPDQRITHPFEARLEQNYPNPFNPQTTINFQLAVPGDVRLAVLDPLGREVAVLINQRKESGNHTVVWDARGMASGVYFYRIQAGAFVETRKLLMMR